MKKTIITLSTIAAILGVAYMFGTEYFVLITLGMFLGLFIYFAYFGILFYKEDKDSNDLFFVFLMILLGVATIAIAFNVILNK